MKRKVAFVLFLGIINLVVMSGCSKDVYDGELYVSFKNVMNDAQLEIFDIGNEDVPIYIVDLRNTSDMSIRLDNGNYMLRLSGNFSSFPKIGFQIKIDSRTWIYYNENNSPTIKEF